MSFSSIQSIQSQNGLVPSFTVQDGSRVFVRVLDALENNTYKVLLLGNPVLVKSDVPLEKGGQFFAKISMEQMDGAQDKRIVRIIPEKTSTSVQNQPEKTIEAFLQSEGLALDELSVRVFAFLEQTGLKIDKTLMQKARMIAARYGKKERVAVEAAAFLLEKGLYPTEEAIAALLYADGDFGNDAPYADNGEERNRKETGTFLDDLYITLPSKKEGILTLSNHVALKEWHWILLPFEWNPLGTGEQAEFGEGAYGSIKILLNISSKTAEKACIKCKTRLNNYSFLLYYRGGKLAKLAFCVTPCPSEAQKKLLCAAVQEIFGDCTVVYSEDEAVQEDGLFTVKKLPPFVSVYV